MPFVVALVLLEIGAGVWYLVKGQPCLGLMWLAYAFSSVCIGFLGEGYK